ncbi:MAG: ATP diphosphatase [Gammaproteobacteria bacterium]|jgi:ATP diphosphatase
MKELERLLVIMKSLRDPENGCPWDKEQTIASIKAFTLEEAYEVVDAIERNDIEGLRDELGDLLFHIVFYSEMADEDKQFNFHDVVKQVNQKLERRHPHVFSDLKVDNVEQVKTLWEQIKQQERNDAANDTDNKSINLLDDISKNMPAVKRAEKLQKRAATVGFDWTDSQDILNKIDEELSELRHALQEPNNIDNISEELGDLMFCCVNLARHYKIDSEISLRDTNEKFVRRFNYIEETLKKRDKSLSDATLDEMDSLWNEAKQLTKK